MDLYSLIESNLFYFIVLPYIIFGLAILMLSKDKKDINHSISKCMVYNKKRYLFFVIFIVMGSILLDTTLIFYVIPKYSGNIWMTISIIFLFIFQLGLALFPDNIGYKRMIHLISAYGSSFAAIIFCILLLLFGNIDLYVTTTLLQFIILCFVIVIFLIFNRKLKKYTFLLETLGIIDWVITLFFISFYR